MIQYTQTIELLVMYILQSSGIDMSLALREAHIGPPLQTHIQ